MVKKPRRAKSEAKMEWLRWAKMECRQQRAEQEIHSPEKELPEGRLDTAILVQPEEGHGYGAASVPGWASRAHSEE